MNNVNGLRLPSSYVEVTDNEMEYLDGTGFWKVLTIAFAVVAVAGAIALTGGAATIIIGGAKATILGISAIKICAVGSLAMFGGSVGACLTSGTPFKLE